MTQARVKGYVVGYDKTGGEVLWSVKVTDPGSAHDGQKFSVAWCDRGMMITKPAVDVTFKIVPVRVGREQVLRAVDVQFPGATQVESRKENSRVDRETLNLVVTELDGERHVFVIGASSRDEAERDLGLSGTSREKVVDFLAFDIYEHVSERDDADIPSAFEIIKALAHSDHSMQALEKFLGAVYRMGLDSKS